MSIKSNKLEQRTAVREVHIEHLDDLTGLYDCQKVFVVFRLKGAVVGQAWLSVTDGCVTAAQLRNGLSPSAWHIWQRLTEESQEPEQSPPTASIVVCTHNRTEDLAQCLSRLSPLTMQGHEIIVVDSCPRDDNTARLVASYPMIRYVYEPRPGAGIARNRGLLAATQQFVAFTDDDALIDKNWLPALLRNFRDPSVAVVTGITMPSELETEAQRWFEKISGFGRGFDRKEFDAMSLSPLAAGLVGASVNVAIRRAALKEIGLFVESLGPGTISGSGEDHEFFYRTLARGYRIVYEPAALVWHRHRKDWDSLRHTLYGYGVGVFAWWTHAFLEERELTLLWHAPNWFREYYLRNLVRSLLKRPDHTPLELAWAEFSGALMGPINYFRSRRQLRRQEGEITMNRSSKSQSNNAQRLASSSIAKTPSSTIYPGVEAK